MDNFGGFNPRICKRCDLTYNPEHLPINVSIHASVKDATKRSLRCPQYACFNPRICKRCDNSFPFILFKIQSFNPRICKRCDQPGSVNNVFSVTVSIHASVKDATGLEVQLTKAQAVSIHASVKDATDTVFGYQRPWYVSIHASVKDATLIFLILVIRMVFQSTHL